MSLLFSAGTHAQNSPNQGRNLAAACATCHGTNGASRDGLPALAGMPSEQMSVTLKAFRDGKRPATIMNQLAKGYSDMEIEAIAGYFASQKPNASGARP
jgi:sulfide dehydrogenase cytochrome subunit